MSENFIKKSRIIQRVYIEYIFKLLLSYLFILYKFIQNIGYHINGCNCER